MIWGSWTMDGIRDRGQFKDSIGWCVIDGSWAMGNSHKWDKWWTQTCGTIWGSWKMVELNKLDNEWTF